MIKDRIKYIRKQLRLSQQNFGDKLGVGRDVISNIEQGRVDPKDYVINLICTTFEISESWLRNGTGEMFQTQDFFSLDEFAKQRELSELDLKIIKAYLNLDPSVRENIIDVFKDTFMSSSAPTDSTLHAKVEMAEEAYIKSISSSAKSTNFTASNSIGDIKKAK